MTLAVVLRDHRGPLSADLRRYYHCNLPDVLAGDVAPLWDVAAWVACLPPESAVMRSVEPRVAHTHDLELTRSIDHSLRWLVWAKTKDGEKGRNMPEPYRFPWEPEPDNGAIRGDAMTVDEAAEFLGWTLHAV